MKYSIFQYSQEKLLEYSLDVTDALILSWFSDFFIGSMEKKIFKDENSENGKLFGWIKLSKVMEDLPCIGINSEKGIKRRFDGFVEKGIMERKSLITQNGKKTYYRPTELYETLINTKAGKSEDSKRVSEKENSHDYQNIHAEKEVSHRTKTTDAETNDVQKSSHDYQNILAERNENILAHNYQNIHALNDSSTKDNSITDALIIQKESDQIFGENSFDSSFPNKAADFFIKNDIKRSDYKDYINFIFGKVSEKNAKNPRGLAYRLFFQKDILQEYLNKKQQQIISEQEQKKKELVLESRKIICPVCQKKFLPDYTACCPECNFEISDFQDKSKIDHHIKYHELDSELKEKYNAELLGFKSNLSFAEKMIYLSTSEGKKEKQDFEFELDKKYGLTG